MAEDKILADGLFFKDKHQNAPEFVIGGLSIKIDQFSKFVKDNKDGEYLNFQILKSKAGKSYIVLDTWKPEEKNENYNPTEIAKRKAKETFTEEDQDILPF